MEFGLLLVAGALALRGAKAQEDSNSSDPSGVTRRTAAGDGGPMLFSHSAKIAQATARRQTGYDISDPRQYAYARDDHESRRKRIITQNARTQVAGGARDPASVRYGGMQCSPAALDPDYAAKLAYFTEEGMVNIDMPQTCFLNPYWSDRGLPASGMRAGREEPFVRAPFF